MDARLKRDWEADLSRALALSEQAREEARSQSMERHAEAFHKSENCTPFDPLHIPSLVSLALSLLVPFRNRLWDGMRKEGFGVALVGGICIGFGLGFAWGQRAIA